MKPQADERQRKRAAGEHRDGSSRGETATTPQLQLLAARTRRLCAAAWAAAFGACLRSRHAACARAGGRSVRGVSGARASPAAARSARTQVVSRTRVCRALAPRTVERLGPDAGGARMGAARI